MAQINGVILEKLGKVHKITRFSHHFWRVVVGYCNS